MKVNKGLNLKEVADKLKISYSTLKSLNPHILKGVIPNDDNIYNLYLPKGYAERFVLKFKEG